MTAQNRPMITVTASIILRSTRYWEAHGFRRTSGAHSIALPSVWRSEFAGKPTRGFFGFHRIDKLDHALVDVITSGTLERSNVKAGGARGNAGQHGSCSAQGAKRPQDGHDASPLDQAGALQSSQSPVYADNGR